MSSRSGRPFSFAGSTSTSFNSTLGSSGLYLLEDSAVGRIWSGPSNRAVRLASIGTDDFYVAFGSSTIVAASTNSVLMLGGTVEAFYLPPSASYIAIKSSTDVTVNITPGYGS